MGKRAKKKRNKRLNVIEENVDKDEEEKKVESLESVERVDRRLYIMTLLSSVGIYKDLQFIVCDYLRFAGIFTGQVDAFSDPCIERIGPMISMPNGDVCCATTECRKSGTIVRWTPGALHTDKIITTFSTSPTIWCMALSPDGDIYTGRGNGRIEQWKCSRGIYTCVGKLTHHDKRDGHSSGVYSLCWLPNGDLCSGNRAGSIKIWRGNKSIRKLLGHTAAVRFMITKKDETLFSSSNDYTIIAWKDGKSIITLLGHNRTPLWLSLSANEDLLYSGSIDCIKMWKDFSCIHSVYSSLSGFSIWFNNSRRFSHFTLQDQELLIATTDDDELIIYDVKLNMKAEQQKKQQEKEEGYVQEKNMEVVDHMEHMEHVEQRVRVIKTVKCQILTCLSNGQLCGVSNRSFVVWE